MGTKITQNKDTDDAACGYTETHSMAEISLCEVKPLWLSPAALDSTLSWRTTSGRTENGINKESESCSERNSPHPIPRWRSHLFLQSLLDTVYLCTSLQWMCQSTGCQSLKSRSEGQLGSGWSTLRGRKRVLTCRVGGYPCISVCSCLTCVIHHQLHIEVGIS